MAKRQDSLERAKKYKEEKKKQKKEISKKKIKKPKIKLLRKKLRELFSLYVRLKETNEFGYGKCITCGREYFYKEQVIGGRKVKGLQAGHFLSKKQYGVRYYDERNVHTQCYSCNVGKYGNIIEYKEWMLQNYGIEVVEELINGRQTLKKRSLGEIEELIIVYKIRLSNLPPKTLQYNPL